MGHRLPGPSSLLPTPPTAFRGAPSDGNDSDGDNTSHRRSLLGRPLKWVRGGGRAESATSASGSSSGTSARPLRGNAASVPRLAEPPHVPPTLLALPAPSFAWALAQPDAPSPAPTEGAGAPEDLLDPRLALGCGEAGMASSAAIGLRDDVDYSRPIGAVSGYVAPTRRCDAKILCFFDSS